MSKSTYIVLHERGFTSAKTPVEFCEHIAYGAPRIEAVLVGSCLVAILEYAEGSETAARYTFERLGSFGGIGASYTCDIEVALREFGIWVRHYAPGTVGGFTEVRSETAASDVALQRAAEAVGIELPGYSDGGEFSPKVR